MFFFFIKTTICLGILYVFYILLLSRIKTFTFNRYFLLGSLVFSLVIPFITIPVNNTILPLTDTTEVFSISNSIEYTGVFVSRAQEESLITTNILLFLYLAIIGVLMIRFSLNLINIIKQIRGNQKEKNTNFTMVLVKEKVLPHTFFNYIMVNKDDYENGRIDDALIHHEITHCNQWHSIDILFIELMKVFLWTNPFIWLMKKPIQLNHEYQADNSVLASHNIDTYQHTLINTVLYNNAGVLVSNFNFSFTKQRLKMMTKQFSMKNAVTNIMASGILVLFLGIVLAFSQKKDLEYKLNVDGIVENYAKNGLKHSDFAMMKITTNNKRLKVEKFEIILARGARIIRLDAVIGNSFDLNWYSKKTREGDRIVMEIKELSDKNIELTQYNSIITIPIDFDE